MKRITMLVTVALMLAAAMALSGVAQAAPISGKADAQCAKLAIQTLDSSYNPSNYTFHGGTAGRDIFTATDGQSEVFCGFGGDDEIDILQAGDIFLGGDGNDYVLGNLGTFYGGDGNDSVVSNYGTYNGGDGNDSAFRNEGTFNGEAGDDLIYYNFGTFNGGAGDDSVTVLNSGTFNQD